MSRRKKGLSAEDRALWDRVKQTATPLSSKAHRALAPDRPTPSRSKPAPDGAPPQPVKPFRIGEAARAPSPPHPGHDLSERIAHAPVRMKQTAHRRMLRGKMKPEARIDLHGMTLADAHPALIHFVADAHDRGLRLLLVITGKGRGSGGSADDGPVPIRRGVLKQQVPGWLTAPPLGALVLDIREAHRKHGGAGAYYVYLRRGRG